MRAVAALCLVIGLAVPALGRAQEDKPAEFPEKLEIGISTDEIAISSDFRGADLTIFGAIEGYDPSLLAQSKYDIVVALEGPKDNNTVRVKERIFGIWVNRRSMTFELVPESYSLSSTRDVETNRILLRFRIVGGREAVDQLLRQCGMNEMHDRIFNAPPAE